MTLHRVMAVILRYFTESGANYVKVMRQQYSSKILVFGVNTCTWFIAAESALLSLIFSKTDPPTDLY